MTYLKKLFFCFFMGCLLSACSSDNIDALNARPHTLNPVVFDDGLDRVVDVYIDPIDIRDVTIDGVSAALKLDKSFVLKAEDNHFKLFHQGILVSHYTIPNTKNVKEWSRLSFMILDDARLQSSKMHQFNAEIIYEAYFDGVLKDLDRFSRYSSRKEADYHRQSRRGYEGIGIVLEKKKNDGAVLIKKVVPNGPADRSGIRVGHQILKIDGKPVFEHNLFEVSKMITDDKKSTVLLTAIAPNQKQSADYNLRKEKIVINTIESKVQNNILYTKITSFNTDTALKLKKEILKARSDHKDKLIGYVLDLSDNPGGLLDQAVEVSDLFLDDGRIMAAKGRSFRSNQSYQAWPGDILSGEPLIVFINHDSASAAEIVAAALDDHHRAVLVGTKSYGKGTVQNIYTLPNQAELYLTWAKMEDPDGDIYHGKGIEPDVCIMPGQSANTLIATAIADKAKKIPVNSCNKELNNSELNYLVAEILFSDLNLYQKLK